MNIKENKVYRLKGREGYFCFAKYEEGMGWNLIDVTTLQPIWDEWVNEENLVLYVEENLEYVDELEVFI